MDYRETLETAISRASLATTVHNTQAYKWSLDRAGATLFCDTDRGLIVADPEGKDAGLSCGAVLEAMVLALSAQGFAAEVELEPADLTPGQGLVSVAHVWLAEGGTPDPLHEFLETRFTWRGAFDHAAMELFGWSRDDARLVLDNKSRSWLASRNDEASYVIMSERPFRRELLNWMRMSPSHPRYGLDGMARDALRVNKTTAFSMPIILGPLWKPLDALGLTSKLIAEEGATETAPVIALFHRPKRETPVESGRHYMRMCLEAAALGMAGWPMAALSDDQSANADVCNRFHLPPDRNLIQAIRFGKPTGEAPMRARRPIEELLIGG